MVGNYLIIVHGNPLIFLDPFIVITVARLMFNIGYPSHCDYFINNKNGDINANKTRFYRII